MEGTIRFEVRPIEGGAAAVGERVTFEGGVDSGLVALNEDGEPFGKVPKRHAEELAPLLEKSYRAEVVGREGGVLTVEVAARDAGPRREQFRLAAYPRSKEERKRVKKLALNSRVFFWEEDGKLEVLDHEGYALGAIKFGDYERVRAACAGAYAAKATLDADGSLSVSVSYIVEAGDAEGEVAAEAKAAPDGGGAPGMGILDAVEDGEAEPEPEPEPETEDSSHQDDGSSSEFLEKFNEVLDRVGKRNVAIGAVAVVAIIAVLVVFWPCNHVYADATCTEPATCTKCGKTEGEALGHDWVDATCDDPKTCTRCGTTTGRSLGHDYEAIGTVEVACTHDGYTVYTCSQCGNSYEGDTVDALGHTVDEWNVDVEATCIETGSKSGTCIVCGETVTESIAMTDHTEGSWETVSEPSVSVSGDSVYVVPGERQLTCSVCGELLETQEIDMEIGETYSYGSYRVGTDIPAGEYKIFCSGSVDAYYCVYPDTSQEDILDNDIFSECAYVKVSDGQLLEVERAVFVSIDDAWSTTDLVGSGVYKVGLDLEAGEYEIVAYSGEKGYYCVWDSVDAETRKIVNNDIFEGTAYITVKKGQYLEISRASADKTS